MQAKKYAAEQKRGAVAERSGGYQLWDRKDLKHMGKLSIANLKKTIYYLQRNGLRNTLHAAAERLGETEKYQVKLFTAEEREALRSSAEEMLEGWEKQGKKAPTFSILVPAYRTNPVFLKELVLSVRDQAYPNWELLILDASGDESVSSALAEICRVEGIEVETGRNAMLQEGDPARTQEKPQESNPARTQEKPQESNPARTQERTQEESQDELRKKDFRGARVRYVRLAENAGISENTNAGIPYVRGEYIALLDHDDVLTPDALYEMAQEILRGDRPACLYSDEDKWDGAESYYEYNGKEDFNLDLLLSNNYICHLLVMRAELFAKLRLRREFDGAQDYDLVLRAAGWLMEQGSVPEKEFRHISKVLYHWRCHSASTAENPRSKTYAYEAGRRALQDFADARGWKAQAVDLKHVGFYRLNYLMQDALSTNAKQPQGAISADEKQPQGAISADEKQPQGAISADTKQPQGQQNDIRKADAQISDVQQADAQLSYMCLSDTDRLEGSMAAILANRADLGAVGGKLTGRGAKGFAGQVLVGGRMAEDGSIYYEGLREGHSGYLHRAVLTQDAEAVDLRYIYVAEDCRELFEKIVGVPYVTLGGDPAAPFDVKTLPENADIGILSVNLGKALREQGKRILWDPEFVRNSVS